MIYAQIRVKAIKNNLLRQSKSERLVDEFSPIPEMENGLTLKPSSCARVQTFNGGAENPFVFFDTRPFTTLNQRERAIGVCFPVTLFHCCYLRSARRRIARANNKQNHSELNHNQALRLGPVGVRRGGSMFPCPCQHSEAWGAGLGVQLGAMRLSLSEVHSVGRSSEAVNRHSTQDARTKNKSVCLHPKGAFF